MRALLQHRYLKNTLKTLALISLTLMAQASTGLAGPADQVIDEARDVFDDLRFVRRQRASTAKPQAFIALFGGYNSCLLVDGKPTPIGSERWHRLRQIVDQAAAGKARWLVTCWDKQGAMYFTSSRLAPRVRSADGTDLSALLAAIARENDRGEIPSYVAGHSHGGWTVLKVVEKQAGKKPVRLLMTIDPISATLCHRYSFWGPLYRPWSAAAYFPDCRRAPSDVDLKAVQQRLKAGQWLHYYQTNFYLLHSSPYAGPIQPSKTEDVSLMLSMVPRGIRPSVNAHVTIDDLASIWAAFKNAVTADLHRHR